MQAGLFIFNLCTRAPSEPMYLVYYSPFVMMLNSQTGHVNDTHVMSLKKPCLSETPASEDVVTARETGQEDDTFFCKSLNLRKKLL